MNKNYYFNTNRAWQRSQALKKMAWDYGRDPVCQLMSYNSIQCCGSFCATGI